MEPIRVSENGHVIEYRLDDLIKFHGFQFHCGLTIAYRAMQAALPELSDDRCPDRRGITVGAAFQGPGARDAIEMVTRAVSDQRFDDYRGQHVGQEAPTGHFAFEFRYGERTVCAVMRPGHVEDEFIALAKTVNRSDEQQKKFAVVRAAMIDHMRATPASDLFETLLASEARPD